MVLTLLLALGLAGVALALILRAAVLPRIRADKNVGRIAAYGYGGDSVGPAPKRTPMFPQLAARVGVLLSRGAPGKHFDELRNTLLAAGLWRTSPASVQGYRAILAGGLTILALWAAAKGGWPPFVAVVSPVTDSRPAGWCRSS